MEHILGNGCHPFWRRVYLVQSDIHCLRSSRIMIRLQCEGKIFSHEFAPSQSLTVPEASQSSAQQGSNHVALPAVVSPHRARIMQHNSRDPGKFLGLLKLYLGRHSRHS